MAKTTVTGFQKDFSTGGWPYILAKLACGHVGHVRVVGNVYECGGKCGRTFQAISQDVSPAGMGQCPCGYKGGYTTPYRSNAHKEEDRLTKLGDEAECKECDHFATALAKLQALKPGDLQHARFRPYDSRGGSAGAFYCYVREPGSPTGVKLLLSIDARPEAEKVLQALRAAPLSPTEPR